MTIDQLVARDMRKLEANITEAKRQMGLAGERFGVLARLRELDRDRKRIVRRLIARDPERESEYIVHLIS